VYSKVMMWMGLDRAIALAEDGVIDGEVGRWRESSELIREDVSARGFDPELGAFRQSYERSVLDASNLLFPLLEFLPFDDPRVQSNLDATIAGLMEEGLIHRYVAGHANHLGLFSEQIDPRTGALLGNFPQAFSHMGLINSALYLAYAEGRDSPVPDPIGSDEHRDRRVGRSDD
jgi:GH15 family glucan-1,4-alpha-glucosidase